MSWNLFEEENKVREIVQESWLTPVRSCGIQRGVIPAKHVRSRLALADKTVSPEPLHRIHGHFHRQRTFAPPLALYGHLGTIYRDPPRLACNHWCTSSWNIVEKARIWRSKPISMPDADTVPRKLPQMTKHPALGKDSTLHCTQVTSSHD